MSTAGGEPKFKSEQVDAVYAVATEGGIRAGARALNVMESTIRSRIDRAEEIAGAKFFIRKRAGVVLTEAGHKMVRYAERMQAVSLGYDASKNDVLHKPGQITIACPGALGTYWLVPHLPNLCDQLPEHLTPSIVNDADLDRDRSSEADIAIRYSDPKYTAGLKRSYLGTLHLKLHASRAYLDEHGEPQTPREVLDHWFIEQDTVGAHAFLRSQIFGNKIGENNEPDESYVRLKTPNASAVYEAVALGQGIAAMPTYVREVNSRIVPIDAVPALDWPIYYYLRREAADSPAVRIAIEWLTACFDPIRYPYFAPEYIHPDEIDEQRESGKVVPLFSVR